MPANRSSVSSVYILAAAAFFAEGVCAAAMENVLVARQDPSVAPAPSITPTAFFSFVSPGQATTCQPLTISWVTNERGAITLGVTNIGVDQSAPPPSIPSPTSFTNTPRPLTFTDSDGDIDNHRRAVPTGPVEEEPNSPLSIIIAQNYDPRQSASTFTWPLVNVPPGWYIINATLPAGQNANSDNFYVFQGSDTSCVLSITTTTSGQATATGTGSTGSTSQASASPVGGASHGSSPLTPGAIIGIAIACISLISVGTIVWLWLHRKRKSGGRGSLRGSLRGGGGPHGGAGSEQYQYGSRGWNGLSSVDSRNALHGAGYGYDYSAAAARTHGRRQSQADSLGTINGKFDSTEEGGAEKLSTSPSHGGGHYNAEGVPIRSPFDDSISTLPVLHHNSQTPQHYVDPEGGLHPPQRSYSASTTGTATTFNQPSRQSSESNHTTYPPSSRSSPKSHSPISEATAVPTKTSNKQANRQSIGARKRKPVPVYDPSMEGGVEIPSIPTPTPMVSPHASLQPPPPPQHYTTASGRTTPVSMQPGSEDQNHGPGGLPSPTYPQLSHKSSFGPGGIEGKQLHYLIPDMPLEQRD